MSRTKLFLRYLPSLFLLPALASCHPEGTIIVKGEVCFNPLLEERPNYFDTELYRERYPESVKALNECTLNITGERIRGINVGVLDGKNIVDLGSVKVEDDYWDSYTHKCVPFGQGVKQDWYGGFIIGRYFGTRQHVFTKGLCTPDKDDKPIFIWNYNRRYTEEEARKICKCHPVIADSIMKQKQEKMKKR